MELGISSGGSRLYRNNDGASYPYNIGSIMNITGSSANDPDYYYFYYNIEIEIPCENISTSISNIVKSDRKLLKITDVLGREVQGNSNQTLFYLFDDGTVERRVTVGI
jgi:hypothetical protein